MSKLSVVVPVYNEEENLDALYRRLTAVAETLLDFEWEFLFVDDASTDSSFAILGEMTKADPRVKAIKLSRNFGSHIAIIAGLDHCTGDVAVNISADLQDPPELIPDMVKKWQQGFDMVWAVRESREDSRLKVWLADAYYFLMQKLALKNTPMRGSDVVLISRRVIDLVVSMGHKNIYLFSAILWLGLNQTTVTYRRGKRLKGVSKWPYSRRIMAAIDSFVSFSYFPIRLITYSGIVLSFTGFLYAGVVVFSTLVLRTAAPGYASLMVAILVLSGIQLLMLGIVAEYLWRVLQQVQPRPLFIVERKLGLPDSPGLRLQK